MRSALALLAALATPAAAQPIEWTWLADVEHDVIDPSRGITSQTVTLTVLMEAEARFLFLSATIFDTIGALNARNGHVADWEVLNSLDEFTGDLTTTDGVSLYNTHAGQLYPFGIFADENPVDVFQFTWQLDIEEPAEVVYVTQTESAVVWLGDDIKDVQAFEVDVLNEVQLGWTVVPAPPAAGALASLVAMRRRRGGPRAAPGACATRASRRTPRRPSGCPARSGPTPSA